MAESISHNTDTEVGSFAGITIQELRRRYENHFNLHPDAAAFVNGTAVPEDYIIQENDKVEFKSPVHTRAQR